MFHHIKRFLNHFFHREPKPFLPPAKELLGDLDLRSPVNRELHDRWAKVKRLRREAQATCVNEIGKGYDQVPVAAPKGYFWKCDMEGHKWRLYREKAHGL